MKQDKITIIILAAGAATRMGKPKQLLTYKSDTVLGRTIATANALSQEKPVVILGAHAQEIKAKHAQHHAHFAINPKWEEGMGNSLVFGLRTALEAHPQLEAIMVLLADQPLIQAGYLQRMVGQYAHANTPIIATQYENGAGVPAIFDKSLFPKLMELKGDTGARKIIGDHPEKVVLNPEDKSLFDIDTPGDYQHLKNL